VGRNSSLIYQGGKGAKPLNNLLPSLREMVAAGTPGPKTARQARALAPQAQPTPRTKASGAPARVRESREAQEQRRADLAHERHERAVAGGRASAQIRRIPKEERGKMRELPNGQRVVTGNTVASGRFVADLADGMSGNARVKVNYKGADGKWYLLGRKGGISPEVIKEYLKGRRRGESLADAIRSMLADFYEEGEDPDESGEAEFFVVQLGRA
jgi:hypothetical protein